jgi:septal ring factor EnvC (AmiA/AmiB activator)
MRFLLILLLVLAPPLSAERDVSREDLEQLRARIDELQQDLQRDLRKRDSLRNELRRTEERISELTAEQRRLDARVEDARERLERLAARRDRLAKEKASQIEWLTRTARASFMSGRQPRLKLLLNQENPARIARLLRYQDYFQQSRSQRLETLQRDLAELRKLTKKVEQARAELNARRQDVAAQREHLRAARAEREAALAKINRGLGRDREKLAELKSDEKRLRKLLDDMSDSLGDITARPGGKPFGELTGKLPWPVSGGRRVDFGDRREGELRWKGVVLNADPGESVRAIQGGRVVYADWLRGYGLLTIIDHGEGYMSLYGYNQTLLRDVGEWVSTGDELALAGQSGGRDQAGLYFEIRRNGDPVNPGRWCSRRVTLPPLAEK